MYRLRKHLIHPRINGPVYVIWLSVPRNSHYDGLVKPHREQIGPDPLGGLVSVHVRHIAVHKDQTKGAPLEPISLYVLFDLVQSLLAIRSRVNNLVAGAKLYGVFQNDLGCIDVEILIIHNQDPLRLLRSDLLFLTNRVGQQLSYVLNLLVLILVKLNALLRRLPFVN